MGEVVDDSPQCHSNSIFQPFPSMVLDDSEYKTMESEWRHELDEILDSIDENVSIISNQWWILMVRICMNIFWLVS